MTAIERPRRVLVADDDAQVLDAYRRVLDGLAASAAAATSDLDALSAELFGDEAEPCAGDALLADVVYCRQGGEAVRQVEDASRSGQPFAIVFLDMRMPPGIDGLETARRIRAVDTHVNIVVVTGYSDHKPAAIAAAVGRPEKLFYLLNRSAATNSSSSQRRLPHAGVRTSASRPNSPAASQSSRRSTRS